MIPRTVLRFSGILLAALLIGCGDDDEPTGPTGPVLEVTDPGYFGLLEGSTQQLEASFDGQPATVSWESSNTAIITVSPTGLVTAVGPGNAAATATLTSDPTKRRSASFTITAPPALESGVPVTGLSSSGEAGSTQLWKVIVPAGATNLLVEMSGGTGDADLYVRQGSPPTPDDWDCRPFEGGNNEVCDFANPAAGTWFVMIELFDPYAGVTLEATITP
jgi:hypothetical protein